MCPNVNSTLDMPTHGAREDDATTLYPESHSTLDTTLVTDSRLYRLLLARLSDSVYLTPKSQKPSTIDIDPSIKELDNSYKHASDGKDDNIEIDEDHYRWYILLGGFLAQATCMGTLSIPSFFLPFFPDLPLLLIIILYYAEYLRGVMQDYYDRQVFKGTIDSTQLSFVGTLGLMFSGLLGPISQLLISAIGTRWVMFIATILTSSGLVLASFSVELWHLYMTQSIIHGIGTAILNIVSMSIAPQWFKKRRGFAMGILMSGSGIGGLVVPFLMNELNETLSGAWCYRVLGIISFVISMICTILLKDKPGKPQPEDGNDKKTNRPGWRNVLNFSIYKDPKFIIWCIAGNLSMMAYFVPIFYLPSHATKLGLLPSQGSMLVAIFSATNIVGRILSGYLGDQFGAVNVNIIFLLTSGMSSLLIWTTATSFVALLIFIVIFGVMSGSTFALLGPITLTITGIDGYKSGISIYLLSLTAARLGPSMAGAIQTATDKNSYFAQQLFTGLAFVLSGIVILILKFKLKRGIFVKV